MKISRILVLCAATAALTAAPVGGPIGHVESAEAAVTVQLGGDEVGGVENGGLSWLITYDDATRRVTAVADGVGNEVVDVQITTAGATRRISFVQPGRDPFPNTDFTVIVGSGPQLIGPAINPNQVARIVGKIGTPLGGLPSNASWSRF